MQEMRIRFSVQFSHSAMSDSSWPHGLQHTRLPCPSPTSRACLRVYVHRVGDAIQPSHTLSSPSPPAFNLSQPASGSFPMSQFFESGGQNIGASASAWVFPMNIKDWFPLGLAGLISLQSKELWRVFSDTTVEKHQFFGAHFSVSSFFFLTYESLQ